MMRKRQWAVLLVAAVAACSFGKSRFAQIWGDAYVVLDSGREARLANHPIHLIPDTAGIDTLLTQLCIQRNRRSDPLQRVSDSVLEARFSGDSPATPEEVAADTTLVRIRGLLRDISEEAWQGRVAILRRLVHRSFRTDASGAFALDSLAPGRYRLWTDAVINGNRYTWLHPFKVERGDSLRVDLSNVTTDENPLKCQTELGFSAPRAGPRGHAPGTALAVSAGPSPVHRARVAPGRRREQDPQPGDAAWTL